MCDVYEGKEGVTSLFVYMFLVPHIALTNYSFCDLIHYCANVLVQKYQP